MGNYSKEWPLQTFITKRCAIPVNMPQTWQRAILHTILSGWLQVEVDNISRNTRKIQLITANISKAKPNLKEKQSTLQCNISASKLMTFKILPLCEFPMKRGKLFKKGWGHFASCQLMERRRGKQYWQRQDSGHLNCRWASCRRSRFFGCDLDFKTGFDGATVEWHHRAVIVNHIFIVFQFKTAQKFYLKNVKFNRQLISADHHPSVCHFYLAELNQIASVFDWFSIVQVKFIYL